MYDIILVLNINNLVEITSKEYDVLLDIKYATQDNFMQKQMYQEARCYLHKDAAQKLKIAVKYAKTLGYKIKIFDGFRPFSVQKEFYGKFQDDSYISDPESGVAAHVRGVAIDLTLVDEQTLQELEMGAQFDEFSEKSHHSSEIDAKILQNRVILAGIMSVAGFTPLQTEWWHFNLRIYNQYPNYDESYPKIR